MNSRVIGPVIVKIIPHRILCLLHHMFIVTYYESEKSSIGVVVTKKFKILIVDDDKMLQDLFEMILKEEFDCETIKVSDGNLGVEALKNANDFSLIISDFFMSDADGRKVYNFNKNHHNIPFFLFSGGELQDCAEFNDLKKINELNCFFHKPFSVKDVLAATQQVANTIKSEEITHLRTNFSHIKKNCD